MNAPRDKTRSYADVTYAQAMQRAEALIPVLRSRATEAEATRRMMRENSSAEFNTLIFALGRFNGMVSVTTNSVSFDSSMRS